MRPTAPLFGYHRQFGVRRIRHRKAMWKSGSPIIVNKRVTFEDPRLQVHVERSGKTVENPFWNPPWEKPKIHPQWVPEGDDPRFEKFLPQPPPEANPLWKEKTAFIYHDGTKLPCQMAQARNLTKSIVLNGLPYQVEDLVGAFRLRDQDSLIRRYVLHAAAWDQTDERLPQYIPPPDPTDPYKFVTRYVQKKYTIRPRGVPYQRQAETLLDNFLRICYISNMKQAEAVEGAPALTESIERRHFVKKCRLQTTYRLGLDDLVHVRGNIRGILYADAPLQPPAGPDAVRSTVEEKLPELWPILPTMDLLPNHIYDDVNVLTFEQGKVPEISHPVFPHTLGMAFSEWWDLEDHLPRVLVLTFGAALAQARHLYGPQISGELPSPVVLQTVATNGHHFYLLTFQLNTLDLENGEGVKNIAWIDAGDDNLVREDWRPTTVSSKKSEQKPYVLRHFNPAAFEKILAMYLNGSVKWH